MALRQASVPQHAMRGAVQMVRTTLAGQIAQDFTQERWQVGPREHGRHRPHSQLRGREPVDLEA